MVERAIEGDKDAANALVKIWYKRIYNFCYRYFYDHDMAAEAAQETFIAMYDKVGTLRQAETFKSWLYRIAYNRCHEEARRGARKKVISFTGMSQGPDSPTIPEPVSQLDPMRSIDNRQLAELLFELINELPVDQRVVVIMKEYEGFLFREIAEALDISENTAKSRLYYGLKSLKKQLEARNLTLEYLLK